MPGERFRPSLSLSLISNTFYGRKKKNNNERSGREELHHVNWNDNSLSLSLSLSLSRSSDPTLEPKRAWPVGDDRRKLSDRTVPRVAGG